MTKLNATAVQNLIALADGKPIFRDAEAIGSPYNLADPGKFDAAVCLSKKKRDRFWSRVETFKDIEDRCRQRRGRGWLYRYLGAIFRFRDRLKRWQKHELLRYCVEHRLCLQHRGAYDEFRVLIEITSRADHKSRSRWAQALRYAYDQREEWQGDKTLKRFFVDNGGVAGCARKIANPRKKKRPRTVRYWA